MERNERIAALRTLKGMVEAALKDEEAGLKTQMLAAYEETGMDRLSVRVGNVEVGKATIIPASEAAQIVPGRESEALDFLSELGLTETTPVKGWEKQFELIGGRAMHKATGEVSDAIEYRPSKAPYVRFTGFKPETVRTAFRARGIEAADYLALVGEVTNG